MKFASVSSLSERKDSEILVFPFWEGGKIATEHEGYEAHLQKPIDDGDFKGKEGEILILYGKFSHETRIALVGLGKEKEITVEGLRRSIAPLVYNAHSKKIRKLTLCMPSSSHLTEEETLRGIAEGLMLPNYVFEKLKAKTLEHNKTVLLESVCFVGVSKQSLVVAKNVALICEGVYLARDLVNGNADDVTPEYLGDLAKELAKQLPQVKATVLNKVQIEKEQMGLLLAVNRGSALEPRLIVMEYQGNPKSNDLTVLVGKGVTFDTGGLNLKPTGSMETMKYDMSGAACAFGTLYATAKLKLPVNLTIVVPSTENCIGGKSYKPGDVYTSYLGKTVEIGNTDAEGRLILADALAYAYDKFKPTRMIDFATLTGTIALALGPEASGLFCNNDKLADLLLKASDKSFERVWRMPLFKEQRDLLKSDIADMKNVGGKNGGAITAAKFLEDFVHGVPWAHFDIAGNAYNENKRRYEPQFGIGRGVRLMLDFLQDLP